MKKYKIIDGHQDISFNSLYITKKNFLKENKFDNSNISKNLELNQSDYVRLVKSGVKIVFGVIFPYNIKENKIHKDYFLAKKETLKQLNYYNKLEKESKGLVKIIKNKKDLVFVLKSKKTLGLILLLEDAIGIGKEISNLEVFYKKGLRMVGPVWNEDNLFGGGTNSLKRLTKYGKRLLSKMQELNMILDTAHMNEKMFWDSIGLFKGKVMNSHTCVYDLNKHKRNLKKNQIKEIAKKGGILGIAFVPEFLTKNYSKAELKDVVSHIKYVEKVSGIDSVAFGSDFDGMSWPQFVPNISHSGEYKFLIKELEKFYNKEEVEKIIYKNWERFLLKSFF